MVQMQTFGTILSSGSLSFFGYDGAKPVGKDQIDAGNFEDRIVFFKLPWQVSIGIGYQKKGRYAFALDGHFYMPLAEYQICRDCVSTKKYNFTGNFNLGAEFYVHPQIPIRFGFFTDFSNAKPIPDHPSDMFVSQDRYYPYVHRFGFAFGLGYDTDKGTFSLGINYSFGFGNYFGLRYNQDNTYHYARNDHLANTIVVFFGGTAKLFPKKELPARPKIEETKEPPLSFPNGLEKHPN